MAGGGDDAATPCKRPPNVKAGIDFPIGETATLLKGNTSGSGPQFTDYAAASVEYLTAEVAELSGIAARKENAKVVEPRHVYSAVRKDEELTELLRKVDIEIDNNAEEEVNGDDEEYDCNSDGAEENDITSDIVEEEYDDTDTEEVVTNASVGDHECGVPYAQFRPSASGGGSIPYAPYTYDAHPGPFPPYSSITSIPTAAYFDRSYLSQIPREDQSAALWACMSMSNILLDALHAYLQTGMRLDQVSSNGAGDSQQPSQGGDTADGAGDV